MKNDNSCDGSDSVCNNISTDSVVVHQKSLAKEKEQYKKSLEFVSTRYPKCFTIPPSPLKIGIHKDLYDMQDGNLSKTTIRRFLAKYCKSQDYKNAHILGALRVDLNGNSESSVTEEQIINIAKQRDLALRKKLKAKTPRVLDQTF